MSLIEHTVMSLRTHHDDLAGLIATLDDAALVGPSGASEWRVCDVLSHLGSGAEIMLRPLSAGIAGAPAPDGDNQAIWDRWNAMTPRDQAMAFVEHDARLVATLEALDSDALASTLVDLGFLPAPVPLVVAAGMRLNEVAQHAWDVRVGLRPDSTLDREAADVLLELFAGPIGFLLGFAGRPDALGAPAVVAVLGHGLMIEDAVALVAEPPVAPTATFTGTPESFVRLLGGRLRPEHTPQDVEVSGNVTLADLRAVFPGY